VKRWLNAVLTFLVLLIVWQELVRAGIWSKVLVPSPLDVAKYLYASTLDRTL